MTMTVRVTRMKITAPAVSEDADYKDFNPPNVEGTVLDDDVAGISVESADDLQTFDGSVPFTIVTAATSDDDDYDGIVVTDAAAVKLEIPLSSSDEGEATVSPTSLAFSTSNWDDPQTVTVTGVNDTEIDGDVGYTVRIEPAVSTDTAYDGLDAADVIAINVDNDPFIPCGNPDMIDDAEDGNISICEIGGRSGTWYIYNESSTAEQSLEAALLDAPREDSIVVMETVGSSVGGWGATIGVSLYGVNLATRLPYDVSDYAGIRFFAKRGTESSYPGTVEVHIVQENTALIEQGGTCDELFDECSDHYADTISVTSSWKEFVLPFSGFYQSSEWGDYFPRDLENVLGFEFLMDYSSFHLMIDDFELY